MGNCWAQQRPEDKYQVEKQRQFQGSCVFCRIAQGSEQTRTVYRDDEFVVFADRAPAARVHLLVVPHAHVRDVNHLEGAQDLAMACRMHELGARLLAEQEPDARLHKLGYHVPPWISVPHLHLHAFALPHIGGKDIKYRLPRVWLPAQALERRLVSGLQHGEGVGARAVDVEAGRKEAGTTAPDLVTAAAGMDRNSGKEL